MLPKDPNILFSYVNTKLRDEFSSLDELCASLMCDKNALCESLLGAGYIYSEDSNKFILKK